MWTALHRRDKTENRKCSSELINVSITSGRTQQENSKLKHVADSWFKNQDPMISLPPVKASIMPQLKICKRSQVSRSETRFF